MDDYRNSRKSARPSGGSRRSFDELDWDDLNLNDLDLDDELDELDWESPEENIDWNSSEEPVSSPAQRSGQRRAPGQHIRDSDREGKRGGNRKYPSGDLEEQRTIKKRQTASTTGKKRVIEQTDQRGSHTPDQRRQANRTADKGSSIQRTVPSRTGKRSLADEQNEQENRIKRKSARPQREIISREDSEPDRSRKESEPTRFHRDSESTRFRKKGRHKSAPERKSAPAEKTTSAENRVPPQVIIRDFLMRLVAFILVIFVLFGVVFGLTPMANADMEPAICAGDLMLYYRLERDVKSDDVVVFKKDGTQYTGRIVAKGGDTVEITGDSQLKVNDSIVIENDIFYSTPQYDSDVTYPITLEEGQYFILCDSREGAKDSRQFGVVSKKEIKGKVITIVRRSGI